MSETPKADKAREEIRDLREYAVDELSPAHHKDAVKLEGLVDEFDAQIAKLTAERDEARAGAVEMERWMPPRGLIMSLSQGWVVRPEMVEMEPSWKLPTLDRPGHIDLSVAPTKEAREAAVEPLCAAAIAAAEEVETAQ